MSRVRVAVPIGAAARLAEGKNAPSFRAGRVLPFGMGLNAQRRIRIRTRPAVSTAPKSALIPSRQTRQIGVFLQKQEPRAKSVAPATLGSCFRRSAVLVGKGISTDQPRGEFEQIRRIRF